MYKCAKCRKMFDNMADKTIRCPSCAYKIVFGQREPIAKHVKAR